MSRILYKYTSAKHLDSILKDGGRLKLTNPKSFNDPFDCYLDISRSNYEKSFRMLTNVAFLSEVANISKSGQRKIFKWNYELAIKDMKDTNIYCENPAITLLVKRAVKLKKDLAAKIGKYKTDFEVIFTDIMKNLRDKTLVGSLTSDSKNVVMWSHYADKHEGICVEYEFYVTNRLLPVVYSDDLDTFDLYTALKFLIPIKYFGIKTHPENDAMYFNTFYSPFIRKISMWSYEKEVRMVFSINEKDLIINDSGSWFFTGAKVKSIIIGHNAPPEMEQEIKSKCQKLGIAVHHIKIDSANRTLIQID